MIKIDYKLGFRDLNRQVRNLVDLSASKIQLLLKTWDMRQGSPVITRDGVYTTRSWTDWTSGFFFGIPLLLFDFTGDRSLLEEAKKGIKDFIPAHLTHFGVHDHGFIVISTYGNLLRLMHENKIGHDEMEDQLYKQALKVSGAIQAARWMHLCNGSGYIYSFCGRHSLFIDTIRSLRSLAVAHQLGQPLLLEDNQKISLFHRLLIHAETTARYNIYFGEGRDAYDVRGRVAQEAIFNVDTGKFRCPSTQQGYSPYSTWTRGLAWALCGFAEQLEFLENVEESEFRPIGEKDAVIARFLNVAKATADFYINNTPADGIPYWDTGAPGLYNIKDYLDLPADPLNKYEPVDSSAAVIAAQGFIRLGNYLVQKEQTDEGEMYLRAGLTVARNVFSEPYLSTNLDHQGLILHSVYHRPAGWDKLTSGEASMWGDYHAVELALLIYRLANNESPPTFFIK